MFPLFWALGLTAFFDFMAFWGRNHLENDDEDINLGFEIIGRLRLIYQALTCLGNDPNFYRVSEARAG